MSDELVTKLDEYEVYSDSLKDEYNECCKNMYDAADGANVFALMTEWRQFRMPSWNVIQKVMTGNIVVDGRNIYDRQELEDLGFVYTRIGEK